MILEILNSYTKMRSKLREKATKAFGISNIVRGFGAADQERNRFIDGLPLPDYYKALIQPDPTPTSLLKYLLLKILSKDRFAWILDDKFASQTLAIVNLVVISCLEVSSCRVLVDTSKNLLMEQIKIVEISHLVKSIILGQLLVVKRRQKSIRKLLWWYVGFVGSS